MAIHQRPQTEKLLGRKITAHKQRCRALPPLKRGEAERLITQYLAHHTITRCPEMYLQPVESNAAFRARVS